MDGHRQCVVESGRNVREKVKGWRQRKRKREPGGNARRNRVVTALINAKSLSADMEKPVRKPKRLLKARVSPLAVIHQETNTTTAIVDIQDVTKNQTETMNTNHRNSKMLRSFKYLDDDLNAKLIDLVKKANIEHVVDEAGVVHYQAKDIECMETELIGSIRSQVFASWQIQTCPPNWSDRYKNYMCEHDIPFQEELIDNQMWFLLPRKYRPHLWKLDVERPRKKNRVRR